MASANRVYVEMDALLDTRLATVAKISQEAAVALLMNEDYYCRLMDDFSELCGVSVDAFRQAYERRDATTIRSAVMTEIPILLKELMTKLEREANETPFMQGLGLDVNIWPYVLEDETKEALSAAIMTYSGIETVPRIISVPYEKLTPAVVKQMYSGMIIYNLHDWLKHHTQAFESVKMPRVSVLAPALFRDSIPEAGTFSSDGLRKDLDPFQLAELGMVEIMGLQLFSPQQFSIVRPDKYQ